MAVTVTPTYVHPSTGRQVWLYTDPVTGATIEIEADSQQAAAFAIDALVNPPAPPPPPPPTLDAQGVKINQIITTLEQAHAIPVGSILPLTAAVDAGEPIPE